MNTSFTQSFDNSHAAFKRRSCAPLTMVWPDDVMALSAFQAKVLDEGERHYRDLPWRYITDPYAVLVSEVMLQQTQVKRVLRYWEQWMSAFPTLDAVAAASVSDILEQWQGLGYNRRALALKRACEECSEHHDGLLPCSVEDLQRLPGIGPATAAGVMAFAYNQPAVYLETNVRTVFLHELFSGEEGVSDKRIAPLVALSCPHEKTQDWYYALLDYGAHLKAVLPNPSRRSAHYSRQSTFEGSRRQKRAELIRVVLARPGVTFEELLIHLNSFERKANRDGVDEGTLRSLLSDLVNEGFFRREGESYYS